MEKITTVVNEKTARELSMKNQILAIGAFIFGMVCVGLYFLFSFLDNNFGSIINIILLGLGGMLMGVSVLLEIGLLRRIKLYKNNGYESTYVFLDDCVKLEAFRNGEKFQDAKIKYNEIAGYIELKNYICLRLNNMNTLPVNKVSGLIEFLESKGVMRRRR